MTTSERLRRFVRDWVPISLLDMFVFSGRSRRWEAAGYTFLFTLCAPATVALAGDRTDALRVVAGLAFGLIWWFPNFALFVRRMHDQNRTAWWVLLPVVGALFTAIAMTLPNVQGSLRIMLLIWDNRPGWTGASGIVLAITLLLTVAEAVLLFWPGTPGSNRHGSDPRVAPDATPALA